MVVSPILGIAAGMLSRVLPTAHAVAGSPLMTMFALVSALSLFVSGIGLALAPSSLSQGYVNVAGVEAIRVGVNFAFIMTILFGVIASLAVTFSTRSTSDIPGIVYGPKILWYLLFPITFITLASVAFRAGRRYLLPPAREMRKHLPGRH